MKKIYKMFNSNPAAPQNPGVRLIILKPHHQSAHGHIAEYDIKSQHRFQNIILVQDYSLAVQLLPQLFSCCFQENQAISVLRLNMYSLVSLYRSCLLELAERADYVLPLIDGQITLLLNCTSLDVLKAELTRCLLELNDIKVSRESSRQNTLIEDIKAYIELHYSENTLSVGQIADYFQMPLSTLSKLFTKNTSVGMLDYIHHVRICHARELLETQKYSVNDVAAMAGYLSASTFIRTFKKHEGVSPGTLIQSR